MNRDKLRKFMVKYRRNEVTKGRFSLICHFTSQEIRGDSLICHTQNKRYHRFSLFCHARERRTRMENSKKKKPARYKEGLWLTKDNRLIRMHGNMTALSYKITNYVLWKSIQEGKIANIQVNKSEITDILQYKNKNISKALDEESDKIIHTTIEMRTNNAEGEDEWEKIILIPYMKYADGVLSADINPKIVPYISGLTGNFTTNNLLDANPWSYAATRLSEVCNSWANVGYAYYTVEEWRALLGATSPSYNAMSQFRRRFLNPAIKEVNSSTNMHVESIEIKQGRKVTHIKMMITRKEIPSPVPLEKSLRGRLASSNSNNSQKTENVSLTDVQKDVVARMVNKYGYVESKAIGAVLKYGIPYCQQQMEVVRKAIQAGKEIRNIGGYLNDALEKGYAQINESLAIAKKNEEEERKDNALWDRQAKEFFGDNGNTLRQSDLESVGEIIEKDTQESEYNEWVKKKNSFRSELIKQMTTHPETFNLEMLKKALDQFDELYPCPTKTE